MTWDGQDRHRHLSRFLDWTSNSETRICKQQVNPIQGKEADKETPEKLPLTRAQSNNAQSRGAQNDNLESVDIEQRQPAITEECERVPFKCREKMRVEKRNRRSGCTTSEAGAAGERVKETDRPGQFQGQPRCRQRQAA